MNIELVLEFLSFLVVVGVLYIGFTSPESDDSSDPF